MAANSASDRAHWAAHPSALHCRLYHRLQPERRKAKADWLVDGLVYAACRQCEPQTYFLAIVERRPTPWACCWSLSRAEYEQLTQLPDDLTVMELLELLNVARAA